MASLLFLFPETRRLQFPMPSPSELQDEPVDKTIASVLQVEAGSQDMIANDQHLGRGCPSRAQFNFLQPLDRKAVSELLHHTATPVEIFFFLIVFWAAMTMGAAANAFLCVNIIQSQALAAPPYNFNPADVGFASFACLGGAVFALSTAGPFSDLIAMRATNRNGGIREPEMRLPALIPFILATAVGMTVVGVCFQHQWAWETVVIIGFGLVGMMVVSIPTIVLTYAIDCYKPVSGQIMVISTVAKNTFGFGMTYYINDWAARDGFAPRLMLLMAMTVGFSIIGLVVMMMLGKNMRR